MGTFERQRKRLPVTIRQQRDLEFAQFIKQDRLDVDARREFYHVRGGVPVVRVPSDQNVSGVQRDVASSPDG